MSFVLQNMVRALTTCDRKPEHSSHRERGDRGIEYLHSEEGRKMFDNCSITRKECANAVNLNATWLSLPPQKSVDMVYIVMVCGGLDLESKNLNQTALNFKCADSEAGLHKRLSPSLPPLSDITFPYPPSFPGPQQKRITLFSPSLFQNTEQPHACRVLGG